MDFQIHTHFSQGLLTHFTKVTTKQLILNIVPKEKIKPRGCFFLILKHMACVFQTSVIGRMTLVVR